MMLSDVCLSVAYIGPKSKIPMPQQSSDYNAVLSILLNTKKSQATLVFNASRICKCLFHAVTHHCCTSNTWISPATCLTCVPWSRPSRSKSKPKPQPSSQRPRPRLRLTRLRPRPAIQYNTIKSYSAQSYTIKTRPTVHYKVS